MVMTPIVGRVIHYRYVWHHEYAQGERDGVKVRPAAIVISQPVGNDQQVVVLPITHSEPAPRAGIEIPAATRQRLGLDGERQWIITNEYNQFHWPGFDLQQKHDGTTEYGELPAELGKQCQAQFLYHARQRTAGGVNRS